MSKEIQVINDELEYVPQIGKFTEEEKMGELGTNYHTVAIIGCQSSGKSTLLNYLFGTQFEVLDQETRGMA